MVTWAPTDAFTPRMVLQINEQGTGVRAEDKQTGRVWYMDLRSMLRFIGDVGVAAGGPSQSIQWIDLLKGSNVAVGLSNNSSHQFYLVQQPPRQVEMRMIGRAVTIGNDEGNERGVAFTEKVTIPSTLWAIKTSAPELVATPDLPVLSSCVYVMTGLLNGIGDESVSLHTFPYGNVYANQNICWGNVAARMEKGNPLSLDRLFFGTDFNGDVWGGANLVEGKVFRTLRGLIQATKGQLPYPPANASSIRHLRIDQVVAHLTRQEGE